MGSFSSGERQHFRAVPIVKDRLQLDVPLIQRGAFLGVNRRHRPPTGLEVDVLPAHGGHFPAPLGRQEAQLVEGGHRGLERLDVHKAVLNGASIWFLEVPQGENPPGDLNPRPSSGPVPLDGRANQLMAALQTKFLLDAGVVRFDRLHREIQLLGDFARL